MTNAGTALGIDVLEVRARWIQTLEWTGNSGMGEMQSIVALKWLVCWVESTVAASQRLRHHNTTVLELPQRYNAYQSE